MSDFDIAASAAPAKEKEDLGAAFIATNKIHMRWNGKVYVGNAHGMEFTTAGPVQRKFNKTRGF